MDISIKEAIKGGKYVNIHRAKPKLTIDVDLLGHCKEIINGYMPELNIEGVAFKYMGPSQE